MPSIKNRRRAQAGTTLVELLVSLTVVSLALSLIVGTFSTGLLEATFAKRNTSAQAAVQYEMDKITAATFNFSAQAYSDCFATENPVGPAQAGYQASCPSGPFTLRADVSWQWDPTFTSVQVWQITINDLSSGAQVGVPVSVYKVNR